jgi:hypothetical protein
MLHNPCLRWISKAASYAGLDGFSLMFGKVTSGIDIIIAKQNARLPNLRHIVVILKQPQI